MMFRPVVVGTAAFYRDITANDYYLPDRWEFRRAVKDLRKHRPRRVLDIGCGSGFFLDRARAALQDCQVWGYEFDAQLAEKGQKRGHMVCSGNLLAAAQAGQDQRPLAALTLFRVMEH